MDSDCIKISFIIYVVQCSKALRNEYLNVVTVARVEQKSFMFFPFNEGDWRMFSLGFGISKNNFLF